jgi:pyruvate/2-oxoglutarate dehydrogenase complex dihydrolipoamide dehydrogenase (E3) component
VTYINGLATLIDHNTILCSKNRAIVEEYLATGNLPPAEVEGAEEPPYRIIRAKNIVIATGTRPTYFTEQQCRNSKLAITSDDIFWMKKKPGNTLVVGGGYVAVEIAGFLA